MSESFQARPQAADGDRAAGAVALIPAGLDAFLVLLRHGETDAIVAGRFQGQMDSVLTEAGERELGLAGRRLARRPRGLALPIPNVPPRLVVHSPLRRTARSAEIVLAAYAEAGIATPPPRPEPGLIEIAQGAWEGLTHDEIQARFADSLAGWRRWPARVQAPGGETLAEVGARVESALARILADLAEGAPRGTLDRQQVLGYPGQQTASQRWALLVGHAGVFRVVVCCLLGLPLEHFWNFDFAPGTISVVEIRAGRAVLRALNLDAHLGRDVEERAAEQAAARSASGAL